jgi:hypothetical protein
MLDKKKRSTYPTDLYDFLLYCPASPIRTTRGMSKKR